VGLAESPEPTVAEDYTAAEAVALLKLIRKLGPLAEAVAMIATTEPEAEPEPLPEPAPEPPPPLTLKQRLAAIRAECDAVGKQTIQMETAKGVKYTIQAHTVEAILAETRPLLAKHNLDLTPNLVSVAYSGNRCDTLVDFTFEVLDTATVPLTAWRDGALAPERLVIRWAGAGCDNSDKGLAKANTNALKEMLKKTFLITDRDDAKEEEDKVEHQTDEGLTRAATAETERKSTENLRTWAATYRFAINNAKDEKALNRLTRDAADTFAQLEEVTRNFFIDEIARKKAEFAGAPAA
jgi:hypothetical protein